MSKYTIVQKDKRLMVVCEADGENPKARPRKVRALWLIRLPGRYEVGDCDIKVRNFKRLCRDLKAHPVLRRELTKALSDEPDAKPLSLQLNSVVIFDDTEKEPIEL